MTRPVELCATGGNLPRVNLHAFPVGILFAIHVFHHRVVVIADCYYPVVE